MRILRLGGRPFYRYCDGTTTLPVAGPADLSSYDTLAFERGCPAALDWAKKQRRELARTAASLKMFSKEAEYLYGIDEFMAGRLVLLTSGRGEVYDSVMLAGSRPCIFGSWLDKSPAAIYSRMQSILGKPSFSLAEFNFRVLEEPVLLRMEPIQKEMTEAVFQATRIRGVTRKFKPGIDLEKIKSQLEGKFRALVGQSAVREGALGVQGLGRLAKAGCWEGLETGCLGRRHGYAPFYRWQDREDVKRLMEIDCGLEMGI